MSLYQIGVLGADRSRHLERLTEAIRRFVEPFGLNVGTHVSILDARACLARAPKEAFAAVYFGGLEHNAETLDATRALIGESLPIIPVVSDLRCFTAEIPAELRFANGMDLPAAGPDFEALASALLECVGLLRRQRRVFVSYRRDDSRPAALQLHEKLGAAGFDVFLDTHDVRPAEDFQAVLWHRLCDSDVMVMLDTPGYFESLWTPGELGRALIKKVAVLGVVWPGHTPERQTQLREPIYLEKADLEGFGGPLTPAAVERVRFAVEGLRSRGLAIRHASLAGAIRAVTEEIGGAVEGIDVHRAITIRLADNRRVRIFPTVGVPTAETFHDVAERGTAALEPNAVPVFVYDHIGLHPRWQRHIDWLQKHLRVVRSLRLEQVGWELAAWES